MSEEKKKGIKEYQKNYRKAKKSQYNNELKYIKIYIIYSKNSFLTEIQ